MKIYTERLCLIPLTAEELRKLTEDIKGFEKELNCTYEAEPMEGFFLDIVKEQVKATEKDSENYVWHTFWMLVRKSDNVVVGSADFKDVPNEYGEVEIGYGLGKKFENNGYMTEAVEAMCNWALKQKDVKKIIAETYLDGFASQRILKRCGFVQYKQGETLWWKR